jgi:hypothetical protein
MKGRPVRVSLTLNEIIFLRWLRDKGGTGARSGNMWIGSTDRLVIHGYVEAQPDRSTPETVHYTLTSRGLAALRDAERDRQ